MKHLLRLISLLLLAGGILWLLREQPGRIRTAEDFGIPTVTAETDFDGDGIDDYTDFLLGARRDAERRPAYDPAYLEGGYPPEDRGVCTDVVWRAFREAGYSLRQMVDSDILAQPEAYPNAAPRDPNIDFRRVPNLHVFFCTHAIALTTDITAIDQWQPGDIVIFGADQHIGIVSDRRNRQGQPYIIHNGGQPDREEDYLPHADVTGHYRFDASAADESVPAAWGKGL